MRRFVTSSWIPLFRAGIATSKQNLVTTVLLTFLIVAAGGRAARADLVYTWGWNEYGQLGNGTTTQRDTPVAVSGLGSGVTAIAAGGDHSLAVQNGGVYAWGYDAHGELGDGTIHQQSDVPVAVSGLGSGVTAVAGGWYQSLAVQNGGLYAWGNNDNGELGDGTTTQRNTPVAVSGLGSGVTAIAAGRYHSLAVQNGGVYALGSNNYGQLGDGTTTQRDTPVAVSGLGSGVTAIAAGSDHSLAVQNGGLYAWGWNKYGQLGNGTTTNSSTPVPVSGLASGVTAVAGGSTYSLAVQNGGVYAWGYNVAGSLGDGTTTNSLVPVRIDPVDLTNILAVAATAGASYALSSNGSLWVWGDNASGELGLGTAVSDYLTPQHLEPPPGFVFTSIAGESDGDHAVATLQAIPEPSTFALLGIGSAAMLAWGWWRRRAKA